MDGPPYEIIYPSFHDIGLSLLRTCIGILILLATRAIVKLTVFWGLKLTFTIDDKSKESLKVSGDILFRRVLVVPVYLLKTF